MQISCTLVYENITFNNKMSHATLRPPWRTLKERWHIWKRKKSAHLPLVLSSCHLFCKWPVWGFSSRRNACGFGNRMSGAAPATDSVLLTAACLSQSSVDGSPAPVSYNSLHTTCAFHCHAIFVVVVFCFAVLFSLLLFRFAWPSIPDTHKSHSSKRNLAYVNYINAYINAF